MALDRTQLKRRRVEARVLFDGSLIDQHAALTGALERALRAEAERTATGTLGDVPEAMVIVEQITALEKEIAAKEKTFAFVGIGQNRWLSLRDEHLPNETDRAEGYDFDPRTFPPAAVARSCVQHPGGDTLEPEDADWLFEELDIAEWSKIWNACLLANLGEADRPKSEIATAAAILSARRSTTARPEASPTRPSSHGPKRTSKQR